MENHDEYITPGDVFDGGIKAFRDVVKSQTAFLTMALVSSFSTGALLAMAGILATAQRNIAVAAFVLALAGAVLTVYTLARYHKAIFLHRLLFSETMKTLLGTLEMLETIDDMHPGMVLDQSPTGEMDA